MIIKSNWIKSADDALKLHGIVTIDRAEDGYHYLKVYKSYISSYGASIVQSGLAPASAFFEKENSNAAGNRHIIVRAVISILKEYKKDFEETVSLAEYALRTDIDHRDLLKHVDKAIAALKIAIRQYKGIKDQGINNDNNDPNIEKEPINRSSPPLSPEEFSQQYDCKKDNMCANIGWLYYRDYYRNFNYNTPINISVKISKDSNQRKEMGTDIELIYKKKNQYICRSLLSSLGKYNESLLCALPHNTRFYLKTTYPGLLIGSGLSHGTGTKNDMKIGFLFDHTTGLPYIPGSSIKGVLRSMFPFEKKESDYNEKRITYIKSKLGNKYSAKELINLANAIFETSSDNSEQKRDIFMDALILPNKKMGYFMGDDFITKHEHPLRNPTPLQFLKVLPEVIFCFSFCLQDSYIENIVFTKEQKGELFKEILEDIGVGAKTNVGYGQFIPVDDSNIR